jgi:hypothetical protein
MKTTTMILAAVFTLSMNILFAGNNAVAVNSEANPFRTSLAPGTPSEATFEEMTGTLDIVAAVNLAPLAPVEADFSDATSETTIDIFTLAPVTPSEADFASDDETTNVSVFAPVTPSVADFSDGI